MNGVICSEVENGHSLIPSDQQSYLLQILPVLFGIGAVFLLGLVHFFAVRGAHTESEGVGLVRIFYRALLADVARGHRNEFARLIAVLLRFLNR